MSLLRKLFSGVICYIEIYRLRFSVWCHRQRAIMVSLNDTDNKFCIELKKGELTIFTLDEESTNILYKALDQCSTTESFSFELNDANIELPPWAIHRMMMPFTSEMRKRINDFPSDVDPE